MAKYKVLWMSDLVTPTGFSNVAHSIIKYLPKDKFEITGLGINYFGNPHNYGFNIFPCIAGPRSNDVYGFDKLPAVLEVVSPDLIFILNDSWITNNYLKVIKSYYNRIEKSIPKIVVYLPVDAEDHEKEWYDDFDIVSQAVAYTQFGKDVIKKAAPDIDTKVIYHGVDTEVFKKTSSNRDEARMSLFNGLKSLENVFIFLNANRNQGRKRLDITLRAFKLFAEGKDDVRLYMHCGAEDLHIKVPNFAYKLGIDEKVILTSLTKGVQQVSVEKLNAIYNACDVGINSGVGEGWGLTSIEHAVTGAPQIVPNHSAFSEIYDDCGKFVKTTMPFTLEVGTTGYLIHENDLAQAMEDIYQDRDLYKKLSDRSIEKFSSDEFSWKSISKIWENLFMEVLNK